MIAFIIWALVGCLFVGLGIKSFLSKEPAGFWANAKAPEVTDAREYNRAMGILWCISGIVFILLGIPLLDGQNSAVILVSVLGSLVWAVAVMVIYELAICRKYRKRR